MGLSEEERIKRLKLEKRSSGIMARWLMIVSALYFILMLIYGESLSVVLPALVMCLVSAAIWIKRWRSMHTYKKYLLKMRATPHDKRPDYH